MRIVKLADSIIVGAIVLSIITLLYYVYYYSWTRQRYFTSPLGPVISYILPAVLLGLSLVSLRWRPSYRINLALFVISMGGSLYAVEVLLAVSNFPLSEIAAEKAKVAEREKVVRIAKGYGIDFDTRSKLEVITDLEKQNIHAVPNISPLMLLKKQTDGTLKSEIGLNGTEILPLGGIANRTTVFCNERGNYVIYESDEHGFHNPKGIWGADHIDIAAVGDSFVQGFCVPSDKNFAALIRKHYPRTLNLGKAGNGPLTELATLKEYLPSLKPKIVLWFYFEGNDLGDLNTEKNSRLLMSYLRNNFTQGLLNRQVSIDQALTAYVEMRKNAGTLNRLGETNGDASSLGTQLELIAKLAHLRLLPGLNYAAYRADEADPELDLTLFGEILLDAKALVGTWDGELDFIDLPAWESYITLEANGEVVTDELKTTHDLVLRARDLVPALVRTMGIRVVDIHSPFEANRDVLSLFVFRQRRHYTEEGNRLVAEEILHSISLGN